MLKVFSKVDIFIVGDICFREKQFFSIEDLELNAKEDIELDIKIS